MNLDAMLEERAWLEAVAGLLSALLLPLTGYFADFDVAGNRAMLSAMATGSVGLMAVSVISINVATALTPSNAYQRVAASSQRVSRAAVAPTYALFVSFLCSLILLALEQPHRWTVRHALLGLWVGLVLSATARSLVLGRRLLEATLRTKGDT